MGEENPKRASAKSANKSETDAPEVIVQISLSDLHDFPNHPFKVRDDEAMQETAESVKAYGILVPAIVRPREDGGYEIIADTDANTPVRLPAYPQCLLSSEMWIQMPPQSLWWTATRNGKIYSPQNGRRLTK